MPKKEATPPAPTIGAVVHYVLAEGPNAGTSRPAIIVHIWDSEKPPIERLVQLQVFTDSGPEMDTNDRLPPVKWATSVEYDPEGKRQHTWHWPPLPAKPARKPRKAKAAAAA